MPRREGSRRISERKPKSTETDKELSRPERRLQQCMQRIARYVESPPKGINIEALRRYISSGDLADREGIISDQNDVGQKNFLAQIDEELERKAILEQEIETGMEILPPVDPNEEMLVEKISAASQSMIKLGAGRQNVILFLSTPEIHYLKAICVDIKDQPGAKEVMRAFIQTANELFRKDEKPEIIIDIDDLFSLVKVLE